MKLHEYRKWFIDHLTPHYDAREAEQFFAIALQELRGWKRVDLAVNPEAALTDNEYRQWEAVLADLKQQKPIQYIFGKAYFYGLEFAVNPYTLIPRPETEELVEWIITEGRTKGSIHILDVGTGSGCIAISLAKNLPDAKVSAIDVSAEALAIARKNAEGNGADVAFIHADVLSLDTLPQQYDVIVSNPPYVRHLEKQEIKDNVLQYEPHLALFVDDDDPLLFYRKIALLGQHALKEGGMLFYEINQYLGAETAELLESYQYAEVELKRDLFGNDRMIKAVKR